MFIQLHPDADPARVRAELQGRGVATRPCRDTTGRAGGLEVLEHTPPASAAALLEVEGVAAVHAAESPHPLVDLRRGRDVEVGALRVGPCSLPVLMAGPCGVESREQIRAAASMAAAAGAKLLRGGAYKPRSSPHDFGGLGREALVWLREAADAHGLAVVTEALSELDVDAVAQAADLIQVGSRNMQNYALLRAVGRAGRPVLLKRGAAARLEDWLLAGEHLLAAGAPGVIFCERGLQGLDPSLRNLLDLGAVALLAGVYRLPVIVDPSHAVGRRDLIPVLGRAALAAGAHGLLVECHPDPARARSDGAQALTAGELMEVGRAVAGPGAQ